MKPDISAAEVYTDFKGLAELKTAARQNSPEALTQVAKQFESLFMQMVLKSMRDANLGEGILDSDQGKFYQDMFDQQLALTLPQRQGVGLADAIVRQLGPGIAPGNTPDGPVMPGAGENLLNIARLRTAAVPVTPQVPVAQVTTEVESAGAGTRFSSPASFVQTMWPYAEKVGTRLGIAPEAVLAQSALESGWGNKVITRPDGRSSFNLFGIKAGPGWQGATVTVPTLEYVDGKPVTTRDTFRAYDSFAAAFDDYTAFISGNPRYQSALAVGHDPAAFGHAMRQAGYATDPEYGNKIGQILRGDALQQAVAQFKGETYAPLI